jgi:ParB family chromosome partitioning protein
VSEFKQIPIEAIKHSPFNPRRQPTSKDSQVIELAHSINAVGLIQPISVRPCGVDGKIKGRDLYQIVAGARRFEAAKLAGLSEISAMVHNIGIDDALKITVTENLQRSDLTPLEEGRGIFSLLASGKTAAEVSADIAKSETWVRRRAKLASLTTDWQGAAEPGGKCDYFSAAHLEIIAHLPESTQTTLLKDIGSQVGITIANLKARIRNYSTYLHHAIFDLKRCKSCLKRTDREVDLFAGMDDQEWDKENQNKARCLDRECFRQGSDEFIAECSKKVTKKTGLVPIHVTTDYRNKDAVASFNAHECKESDKGAVPAIQIDGENAGKTFWIMDPDKLEEQRKAQRVKSAEGTIYQKRIQHQSQAFNAWLEKQVDVPTALDGQTYLLSAIMVLGIYPDSNTDASKLDVFKEMITNDLDVIYKKYWEKLKRGLELNGADNAIYIDEREERDLALALEVCGLDPQDFIDAAERAFPDEKKSTKKTNKGAKK